MFPCFEGFSSDSQHFTMLEILKVNSGSGGRVVKVLYLWSLAYPLYVWVRSLVGQLQNWGLIFMPYVIRFVSFLPPIKLTVMKLPIWCYTRCRKWRQTLSNKQTNIGSLWNKHINERLSPIKTDSSWNVLMNFTLKI